MSEVGNVLKQAHDVLIKGGNCVGDLYNEKTGEHCAWGALNRVLYDGRCLVQDLDDSGSTLSQAFLTLERHLPEGAESYMGFDYISQPPQWGARSRVVRYNNWNPGQPVIDLFAKAAADEGYDE